MFPRPKASNKTSFGATRSFFPPKLRNSQFHNYFIFYVPSPLLTLLLVMVVVVVVIATIQEYKKKKKWQQLKNTRNQQAKETQETQSQEKSATFNIK
jgi:magnesium-transporting ATPase (P-type)